MTRHRFLTVILSCTLAFLPVSVPSALAQSTETAKERDRKRKELDEATKRLQQAMQRQQNIREEIERLNRDRGAINRALLAASQRGQELETSVAETEARLSRAVKAKSTVQKDLVSKRALLAEVIGSLQRMGRKPPPALLVTPQDALSAVRSAVLLGAVVPRVRGETQRLMIQMQALVDTTEEVEKQRAELGRRLNVLAEDETRLAALIEEKNSLSLKSREELNQQKQEAEKLAAGVLSLEQLIERLESKIAAAARAAEAARTADEKRIAKEEARLAEAKARLESGETPKEPQPQPAQNKDADRKEPAIAFTKALGTLPKPAAGKVLFGYMSARDSAGNARKPTPNTALETRPNARVSAPADGWIVYAGQFRSYGKIIILNAGEKHHVVLSGLSEVNVEAGRFVLAGEPVGRMGAERLASAVSPNLGSKNPLLTIEFRKDGQSIDPTPWWQPDTNLADTTSASSG